MPIPSSQYDDLEHALWLNVMCKCEHCDRMDLFDEYDKLADSDPIAWAQAVAPLAQALGWSSPDSCTLVCGSCSAKNRKT